VTLELVPFRGHTVPVLNGEISRYNVAELLAKFQYSQQYMGAPTPVTTYGNRPAEPISSSFEGFVWGMLYGDGPVAAVEAYRLRVFGQAPLLYQEMKDGRPGDLFDDDRLDRLRTPWPGGNLGDLMKRALIYGDFAGNAFIVDLDDELVLLRPDWVEIVLSKRMVRGGQVGWRQVGIVYYEGGLGVGDGVAFLPGEYCHFVPGLPDPLATFRGMSWLTPLVREVQADKSAGDHKVAFFENAASPNLAVSLPKEITPAQFKEFVDKMDSEHRGATQAYKTLYTAGGADVTVIGANMQQMDFSAVQGKGETRIANAGGVSPALLSFSEGMQGSSLNAGNFVPAKRNFVDTTMRDLWTNWAGSIQKMDAFAPPEERKSRLSYDPRDIPFLRDDEQDIAQRQQTQASTISSLITAGYKPDSAQTFVVTDDPMTLEHTGLTSVQLMPPGSQDTDGDGVADVEAEAADEYEAALDEFRSELEWRDEILRRAPYPGQRYRHGWVPIVGMTGDALRLGGRMDLEPGESLVGSDRIDGADRASTVLLAATDSPRGRRLRVGVTLDEDKRSWTGRNRGGTVVLDEAGQTRLRDGLASMAERGADVADRLKAIDRELDDLADRRAEIERRQYVGMTKKQSRELARLDEDIEIEERSIRRQEAEIASPPPDWDSGYLDYKRNGVRLQRQKLNELAARRAELLVGRSRQPLSAADEADLAELDRATQTLNREFEENYLDRVLVEGLIDGEWGSVSWSAETDDSLDPPRYFLSGPDEDAEPVSLTAAKLEELIRLLGQEVAQRSYIERRDYYDIRVDAGRQGGGRFRKLSDIVGALLNDWLSGKGDADDPLDEFESAQLRTAAKGLGIPLPRARRGASPDETRNQLKLAILKDARARFRADRDSEGDEPRQARITLSSPKYRDVDAGVYQERNGKVSLYRESSTGQRGSRIASFDDLAGLEAWGRDNDEPQVASWAASERAPAKKAVPRKAPAKKAPAKKAAVPATAPAVRGRDLTGELDFAAIAALPDVRNQDTMLGRIWAEQGFDGPPQVVADAEWERLHAEGGVALFRGLRGWVEGLSAEEMAASYRSGEHYPGLGSFGNGSYFGSERDTAVDYSTGKLFGHTAHGKAKERTGSAILEVVLLPDARIIDYKDIRRLQREQHGISLRGPGWDTDPRVEVLWDEGRWASAMGYDAIRMRTGVEGYGDEYVVLNRTATAVRESTPSTPDLPSAAPPAKATPRKAAKSAPAKATPKPKREPLGDPAAKLSSLRALGDREAARDELDLLLLDDLKTLAKTAGVATSGRKRDVADRIAEKLDGPDAESPAVPAPWRARLDADREMLERVAGGEPSATEALGGNVSDNSLVTYPDGTRAVRKKYEGVAGRLRGAEGAQEDAEELAPLLLAAVGIRAPAVVRTGANAIEMTHIPGETGYSVVPRGTLDVPQDILDSDDGRLLGLADALMGMTDRNNPGNWLIQPDGHLAGIDHSLAWFPDSAEGNPFAAHFLGRSGGFRPNDMTRADMAELRRRLEALRPQFEAKGRGDWFELTMTRLDAIEKKARGTRDRIAGGDVGPKGDGVVRARAPRPGQRYRHGWIPIGAPERKSKKPAAELLSGPETEDIEELRPIVEGTFGGLTVKATHGGVENDEIEVFADIYDGDGTKVGKLNRVVTHDDDGDLYAVHGLLQLDPDVQGQGFAEEFNANLEEWYRASGVTRIELTADIDVGGYAWARKGYDFRDGVPETIASALRRAVGTQGRRRYRISDQTYLPTDDENYGFVAITPNGARLGQFGSRQEADLAVSAHLRASPDVDAELADVVGRLDAGEHVGAYEISQLGRQPGQSGPDASWLGKEILLGSEWEGVKWL
jgi:hypothetical protein